MDTVYCSDISSLATILTNQSMYNCYKSRQIINAFDVLFTDTDKIRHHWKPHASFKLPNLTNEPDISLYSSN